MKKERKAVFFVRSYQKAVPSNCERESKQRVYMYLRTYFFLVSVKTVYTGVDDNVFSKTKIPLVNLVVILHSLLSSKLDILVRQMFLIFI